MHGSPGLLAHSLIRETTEQVSQNNGYKFGQEEETLTRCTHSYFGIVDFSNYASSTTIAASLSSWHGQSWESGLPPSTSPPWCSTSTGSTSTNRSSTAMAEWLIRDEYILNRAGLGLEVMHERNLSTISHWIWQLLTRSGISKHQPLVNPQLKTDYRPPTWGLFLLD